MTRSPPSSGALLPISTIRPASVARGLGSSISVPRRRSTGTADNPARRSVASRPSGRRDVTNDAACRRHRSAVRRLPARAGPPRPPDPAERSRQPAPAAEPGGSDHPDRPPRPGRRSLARRQQVSASGRCRRWPATAQATIRARANRIGVAGRSWPEFAISSTNPSTDGTADSARASAASPFAENRSGPANSISSANTAGRPAAVAETSSAMRWRGQGHGPKRASAARSISTMTTSGAPADCRDSSGNRRSNARSRSAWRAAPGENAHPASNATRRTSPTRTGRLSRPRIAIDADFRSMANC